MIKNSSFVVTIVATLGICSAGVASQASASGLDSRLARTLSESDGTGHELGGITITDSGITANGTHWVEFIGEGEIDVDSSALSASPSLTAPWIHEEDVEGGRWRFGSSRDTLGRKTCLSAYNHPNRRHSASVKLDNNYNTDTQDAKKEAYSHVSSHTTSKCQAFYSSHPLN